MHRFLSPSGVGESRWLATPGKPHSQVGALSVLRDENLCINPGGGGVTLMKEACSLLFGGLAGT